jgi:hypothetical protein
MNRRDCSVGNTCAQGLKQVFTATLRPAGNVTKFVLSGDMRGTYGLSKMYACPDSLASLDESLTMPNVPRYRPAVTILVLTLAKMHRVSSLSVLKFFSVVLFGISPVDC